MQLTSYYFFYDNPSSPSDLLIDVLVPLLAPIIAVFGSLLVFYFQYRRDITKESEERRLYEQKKLMYLGTIVRRIIEFGTEVAPRLDDVIESIEQTPTDLKPVTTHHLEGEPRRLSSLSQEDYFLSYFNRIGATGIEEIFDAGEGLRASFEAIKADSQNYYLLDYERRTSFLSSVGKIESFLSSGSIFEAKSGEFDATKHTSVFTLINEEARKGEIDAPTEYYARFIVPLEESIRDLQFVKPTFKTLVSNASEQYGNLVAANRQFITNMEPKVRGFKTALKTLELNSRPLKNFLAQIR